MKITLNTVVYSTVRFAVGLLALLVLPNVIFTEVHASEFTAPTTSTIEKESVLVSWEAHNDRYWLRAKDDGKTSFNSGTISVTSYRLPLPADGSTITLQLYSRASSGDWQTPLQMTITSAEPSAIDGFVFTPMRSTCSFSNLDGDQFLAPSTFSNLGPDPELPNDNEFTGRCTAMCPDGSIALLDNVVGETDEFVDSLTPGSAIPDRRRFSFITRRNHGNPAIISVTEIDGPEVLSQFDTDPITGHTLTYRVDMDFTCVSIAQ